LYQIPSDLKPNQDETGTKFDAEEITVGGVGLNAGSESYKVSLTAGLVRCVKFFLKYRLDV